MDAITWIDDSWIEGNPPILGPILNQEFSDFVKIMLLLIDMALIMMEWKLLKIGLIV